jgi:hypothetical protein
MRNNNPATNVLITIFINHMKNFVTMFWHSYFSPFTPIRYSRYRLKKYCYIYRLLVLSCLMRCHLRRMCSIWIKTINYIHLPILVYSKWVSFFFCTSENMTFYSLIALNKSQKVNMMSNKLGWCLLEVGESTVKVQHIENSQRVPIRSL